MSIEELRRYTAGTMAAEEMLRADAHVASCAACRGQLLAAPRLAQAVKSLAGKARWDPGTEFNCLDDERAAAYVEGTLDAADHEIVESHLELCPQCVEDVRALRQFRAEMSTYPPTVYTPEPRRSLLAGWTGRWQTLYTPRRAYVWAQAGAWLLLVALVGYQAQLTARLSRELDERTTTIVTSGETEPTALAPGHRQSVGGTASLAPETPGPPLASAASIAGLAQELRAVARRVDAMHEGVQKTGQRVQGVQNALQGTVRDVRHIRDQLQQQETALAALRRAPGDRSGVASALASTAPGAPAGRSLAVLRDGGDTSEVRLVLPGVSLPRDLARATEELLTTGEAPPAAPVRLALAQLSSVGEVVRSGDEEAPVPLSPARTFIVSTRPAFRWQRVPDATGYVVSLFDDQARRRLWHEETTGPDRLAFPTNTAPLRPGGTYSWRVEARGQGEPSLSSLTRFRVLPEPRRAEVLRLTRRYARFHTILAALYQREGLYDDAERELQELLRQNPNSALAKLLRENFQRHRSVVAGHLP